MDVLVVGAGIIGLTTAIRLAEAGAEVRLVAGRPPGSTTSAVASAMVGPTFAPAGQALRRWEDVSVAVFAAEPPGSGVRLAPGLLAARQPAPDPSPIAAVPPGVDGVRIVHNYGHGGLGVTLAWGCAADAAALLLS